MLNIVLVEPEMAAWMRTAFSNASFVTISPVRMPARASATACSPARRA